ncbi:MAG: DNA-directed RNA polymerase subunit beta', partial [Acidimicrobiales bacterium]|nr:DNA-directed RNA polymerase subunit beta' [Acidimicrobiales bacterium]
LSAEAQAESRVLMLSANNVLSPAHGRPLVTPTQDMVIGGFYLTELVGEVDPEDRTRFRRPGGDWQPVRSFRRVDEIERAYESGGLHLHDPITFRADRLLETPANGSAAVYTITTPGRVFFNEALPDGFEYINEAVKKKDMGSIVDELANHYPKAVVAESLDNIKALCFRFATQSGITVSIDDVRTPPEKQAILESHEKDADKVEGQFKRGIITDGERRQKEVEIWTNATEEVRAAMEKELKSQQFNPIEMMVGSGARGNMMQVRQIAGMRGLVANPRGDMIPRPIKANFREGLSMLEYFIATPGARKGLVDTALRTADSGYLTRRLVDVAQELIVREQDCAADGTAMRGLWVDDVVPDQAGKRSYLETRLFGRTLIEDVGLADGTVLAAGTEVGDDELEALRDDPEITRVRVRSVLTCQADQGVCAKCYGRSLATGRTIELGEAVGVIAAQSIGEP